MTKTGADHTSLDDFTRIGRKTPVLADLKPSGRYVMADLVRIGGVRKERTDFIRCQSPPTRRPRPPRTEPSPRLLPPWRGAWAMMRSAMREKGRLCR